MKLFLASQAGRTIDLFNNEFFSLKNKKVAFIANAADFYESKAFVYFDKVRLKDYGAQIFDVDLREIKGKNLYTSEIPLIYDEWKSHAYPSDIHGLVFLIMMKNKHDC